MNKKELVSKVTELLRDNGFRKKTPDRTKVFTISDDAGNENSFTIKIKGGEYQLTKPEVAYIFDTFLEVIKDNIRHGIETNIHGFGSMIVHKREARAVKMPGTEQWVDVVERYLPKFNFGNELRAAAKIYEASLDNRAPFAVEEEKETE